MWQYYGKNRDRYIWSEKLSNSPIKDLTFAFIGAGNMSGAILGGMVNNGVNPSNIIATNRSAEKQQTLKQEFGVVTELSNKEAIAQADIVILGVKPQMMKQLLQELVDMGTDFSDKLVITVAAGLQVQSYTDIIGSVRFIRSMPNTPSLVGLGVAGLYSGTDQTKFDDAIVASDKEIAAAIFNQVGEVVWLEQESGIDDISSVSGSGPAYFFLFMEHMAKKAEQLGFSPEQAKMMVMQTALGAATMAQTSTESFEQLRLNVTSPGGSTAEAIKHFQQQELQQTTFDALDAAIHRAREMSKL